MRTQVRPLTRCPCRKLAKFIKQAVTATKELADSASRGESPQFADLSEDAKEANEDLVKIGYNVVNTTPDQKKKKVTSTVEQLSSTGW